jgi:hypothetical protein
MARGAQSTKASDKKQEAMRLAIAPDEESSVEGAMKYAIKCFSNRAGLVDSKKARKERNISNITIVHDYWSSNTTPPGEGDQGEELERYVTEARSGKFDIIPEHLRLASADLMERGVKLHPSLQEFVIEFLRNPTPWLKKGRGRGNDPHDLVDRNVRIFCITYTIHRLWGLPATRHARYIGRHPSAASIVRDALAKAANINKSEATINAIYDEYKPRSLLD